MPPLKVSIIVPVFNNKDYFQRAIESALFQDYGGLVEVIVIDNESTDMPLEEKKVLMELLKDKIKNSKFPRVLLFDTVPNVYKYSWHEPTFRGMEMMKGDIFMFLGSDDYLQENFVSNNAKIFKSQEKIKCLQSYVRNVGAREGIEGYDYSSLGEFKAMCLERCPVKTPTVMYRKELFEKGRMTTYPDKFFGADDYWRVCNLAEQGLFIFPVPKWLGYNYNWHPEMATVHMHKDLDGPNSIDKMIQDEWREKWKM
jgi:glycosyltransferase involved in cell wall biosynthesis